MWFILGLGLGYAIAQNDAESKCPELSQLGCDKQQFCVWKSDQCVKKP